jgi:Ca2+-binding EF-hand superfamily protein
MLEFLDYYGELSEMFQELDTNGDRRISFKEFKKGFELTGDNDTDDNYLKAEFNKIDTDKGGFILFDEVRYFNKIL